MRTLRDREEATPLGLAGAGVGEPLVPALGSNGQESRVPVADVAAVVGGHQVLVPRGRGDRTVHLVDAARRVERGEGGEGPYLPVPRGVAARVGDVPHALLDRTVNRPAE